MIIVSNASPLITLARIGHFDLLQSLFGSIHIAGEVFTEVVLRGKGRPAATAVQDAQWIEAHPVFPLQDLAALSQRSALGQGELATILLAQALHAELVLIDERAARRLAVNCGLNIIGCLGLLEIGYQRGLVSDLRTVYVRLLAENIRIDKRLLNLSLKNFRLDPI